MRTRPDCQTSTHPLIGTPFFLWVLLLAGISLSLNPLHALAKGQGNSIDSCSVVPGGDGQVRVTVNAGPAIKSVYVYGTPPLPSGQSPACSGTSCTISNLVPGQVYQFFVNGTNNGGNQGASGLPCNNGSGVKPGGSPPPNPPSGITPTPGNQQLVVNWTPPPGPVSGYKVCVTSSPSSDCNSGCLPISGSCAVNPGPVNQCLVTGISNGTAYYVSMAAQNGGGYGACASSTAPITPAGLPDAPLITGITPSDSKLHVLWNKPNNNGSPIIGYLMQVGPSANGPWSEAPGGCASSQISLAEPLSCDASPLVNGQTYYFRVAAQISGNQVGLWSNVYQGVPKGLTPTAYPDQYLMSQGGTLDTALTNGANQTSVKNNDQNVAQVSLSGAPPAHAQRFSLNSGGGFIYTPVASFTGTDSFLYVGSNGNQSTSPTKVTITISPTNQPPISNDDTYKVSVGNMLTVDNGIGVLKNDGDPEHHSLTAYLLTAPKHGIIPDFDPLGGFLYTPNPGFEGTDSFTYKASDGQHWGNVATVSILVSKTNHAPVANPIGWSTAQDVPLLVAAPGVLSNDTDPDRDALNAILATKTQNGSVTLASDGSFKYIPNPGYIGTDSFTYVAKDGSLSSVPATVTITVNALATNKPPTGVADIFYVPQGKTLTVTREGGVLANDVDPENHPLSRTISSQSIHGTFSPVDAGGFTYIPSPTFTGVDTFSYLLTDGHTTVGPIEAKLVVLPINQKPTANPDAWSLYQDGQLYVSPLKGVLVNDTDPQGSTLKAILLTQPGKGLLNPIAGGGFGYIPNAGFTGQDSFTYKVTNGVMDSDPTTVYLNVNAVPSKKPPVANPDSWTVGKDQILNVADRGVLVNDFSTLGVPLFATPFTQPAHGTLTMLGGGGFSYTPNAGFTGQDAFYYTAVAGSVGSNPALVSITVTETAITPPAPSSSKIKMPGGTKVILPPPPTQNPVPPTGTKLPPKPEVGPGRVVIKSPPSNGSASITPDGGYVYAPNPGFVGTDNFTIANNSGGNESGSSTISVTVNPPQNNRPPQDAPRTYRSLDGASVIYSNSKGLLQSARDPDGDYLKPIIVSYPQHGYLELQQNGEFAYYPDPGFKGVDTFSWKSNDGLADGNVVTDRLICSSCNRRE